MPGRNGQDGRPGNDGINGAKGEPGVSGEKGNIELNFSQFLIYVIN